MNSPAYENISNTRSRSNVSPGSRYSSMISSSSYAQERFDSSIKEAVNNEWIGIAAGFAVGIGFAVAASSEFFSVVNNKSKDESYIESNSYNCGPRNDSFCNRNNNSRNNFSQNHNQHNNNNYHREKYNHNQYFNDDCNCSCSCKLSNNPSYNRSYNHASSDFISVESKSDSIEYPVLRQNNNDSEIKIGTLIALKHDMTGKFLNSNPDLITKTGSYQQMVFCYRSYIVDFDWWQVIPANVDVIPPGTRVTYGSTIRLRHHFSSKHLHSHATYICPITGQNEVTCFGGKKLSDSNDHWIIEPFGSDKRHGQVWNTNDAVIFTHQHTGETLCSHDVFYSHEIQAVTTSGNNDEENSKWMIHLTTN
ncbi:Stromal cell-derived factor 2-like protein [Smittium culicis]|uniref:Stromal cell-derived factor 2-like protein n=1 Tax=Smittium culicis TaxID=133412 RepID=A0A1R1Y9J7_9FUNG|nr:Stromal cell-derived factor 2-like protein [Smittium culicis]